MKRASLIAVLVAAVSGCGDAKEAAIDPVIAQGKAVWEGTCRTCHLNGIGGAPKMGNRQAWAPRIAKGVDTLIGHAQRGFDGDEGSMPARGGNAGLSDADVAAAVRYMVAQSR